MSQLEVFVEAAFEYVPFAILHPQHGGMYRRTLATDIGAGTTHPDERLNSSEGGVPWNARLGRRADQRLKMARQQ